MKNLDEKRREVQHAFEAALKWADSGERRPFFAFEKCLFRPDPITVPTGSDPGQAVTHQHRLVTRMRAAVAS